MKLNHWRIETQKHKWTTLKPAHGLLHIYSIQIWPLISESFNFIDQFGSRCSCKKYLFNSNDYFVTPVGPIGAFNKHN